MRTGLMRLLWLGTGASVYAPWTPTSWSFLRNGPMAPWVLLPHNSAPVVSRAGRTLTHARCHSLCCGPHGQHTSQWHCPTGQTNRATVGSGVLGAVTAGDDGPLAPRLDLCCTAHATPGVKRLVKSVVRGLKVGVPGRVVGSCL